MAEETTRLFSGINDETMLAGAELMRDIYADDVAQFAAFDASFNAAFLTNWDAVIDNGRAFPSDETVSDVIAQLTETLNDVWESCKNHFQDSKYFIEKAFDSKAKQNEFGFDDYRKMTREQDKVVPFMDQFHTTAEANAAALIAQGYTQAKIDAIEDLSEAFREANRAQEKAKKDRLVATQTRIETMNEVWVVLQRVNKASKSVFRGNAAKLQQYLLPAAGTNETDDNLSIRGKITDTDTNAPIVEATVTLPALSLSTTTDDNGNYAFAAGIAEGSTAIVATSDGYIDFSDAVSVTEGELTTKNIKLTKS